MSRSLALARTFLGQPVTVIDCPLGSHHPRHQDIFYLVNYGYLPGTLAPDVEALDAYVLGVDVPLETFYGRAAAIIHRKDDDDKLVVVPEGLTMTDAQIMDAVMFQEQFFRASVVRY